MEPSELDPLIHYKKVVGRDDLSFTFTQINMTQLRTILTGMKSTGSTGTDDISMKILKQAQPELEPLLLHLVNATIKTNKFPEALKETKVVLIQKLGKDATNSDGWRPVNVVTVISKVIECVFLRQILLHLDTNHLIGQQHHGAVRGKSTQTLITELQDLLVDDRTQGKESFLVALDQSKAYNLVCHIILLRKLEAIGFKPQAIRIMKSFLSDRKQYVQVEGHRSESLTLGPNSVIHGSTLSCVMYLIYILDLPEIFHEEKLEPKEYRKSEKTNIKAFIDDIFLKAMKIKDKTFKESVEEVMKTVERYTKSNKLALNPDKSMIQLNTKDKEEKEKFAVEFNGKTVKHNSGNLLSDQLTWDIHVKKILLPALSNRVRSMRIINKYLGKGFRAIYSNSTFRSRLMFGIETWGGSERHS